jgi:hypothetical protein
VGGRLRARGKPDSPVTSTELPTIGGNTLRIAGRPRLLRAVVAELRRLREGPFVDPSRRPLDRRQVRAESLNQTRTDR